MNKFYNIIILFVSQISICSYLVSSYAEHNFDEVQKFAIKVSFLLIWFSFYLLSFNLIKSIRISKKYNIILVISIILTIIGIFNAKSLVDPFYVFFLLFSYLHIFLYLSTQTIKSNIYLLRNIILLSGFVYIIFNYLNLFFNGNTLYTLGMIEIPVLLFGLLVIFSINKSIALYLFPVFFIFILTVAHGIFIELDNNSLRLQYIPLGLIAMLIIVFFLALLNLPMKLYLFIFSLGIIILIIFFEEVALIFMFENRLISLLERLHIFLFMMDESFWFTVPQGFGSSLKQFDLSNLSFIGERVLYPPHSGIAVILYEFSILGTIYFIYVVSMMLKIASFTNYSRQELSDINSFSVTKDKLHGCKFFSNNKYKLIKYLLIFFWLIQNLLYLKGIITPDYFSDSGIIIYMLIFILIIQSNKFNFNE